MRRDNNDTNNVREMAYLLLAYDWYSVELWEYGLSATRVERVLAGLRDRLKQAGLTEDG